MKNLGRNLKILILTTSVIVITAIAVFVYVNALSSVKKLKSDIAFLQTRFDELTEKNLKKDRYNYELKYIKYEISQVQKVLPPDIEQERVILSLRRIEKASGAKIAAIKFSPIERVGKPVSDSAKKESEKKETPSPSPSNSNNKSNDKTEKAASKTDNKVFTDGEQLQMKVDVTFRAPYNELKNMLEEISREVNRVVINSISIQRDANNSNILSGALNLTFHALKDSKRTFNDWELQLEKGITDLFVPFDGYVYNNDVILPKIDDKYKTEDVPSDFYLIASPFNDVKPAVLIGKYESINSEIFYDGNTTIDLNFYVGEKNGQVYYRTRTKQMPYPDESNSVLFFPKQDDVTMNIVSAPISGGDDRVRVRLNVFNDTDRRITIFTEDSSERVSVVVKQGKVITMQKALLTN